MTLCEDEEALLEKNRPVKVLTVRLLFAELMLALTQKKVHRIWIFQSLAEAGPQSNRVIELHFLQKRWQLAQVATLF